MTLIDVKNVQLKIKYAKLKYMDKVKYVE